MTPHFLTIFLNILNHCLEKISENIGAVQNVLDLALTPPPYSDNVQNKVDFLYVDDFPYVGHTDRMEVYFFVTTRRDNNIHLFIQPIYHNAC